MVRTTLFCVCLALGAVSDGVCATPPAAEKPADTPTPQQPAATPAEPNYITQRLLIFNAQGDVLLQRNAFGWSTPGLRFDAHETIRQSLDGLARKYGVTIRDVRLAGLFTYEYGYSPAISTRSHYAAVHAGGEPIAPDAIDEVRWVPRGEAVALVSNDLQRAPPAFVEQFTRMLAQPDTVWGGAWHVAETDGVYSSRVIEPMHPLGGGRR